MTVRTDLEDVRSLSFAGMTPGGPGGHAGPRVTPVSPCFNWVEVNSDASLESTLTIPGDLHVGDSEHLSMLKCGQTGTSVLVRMKYPQGVATVTTIRVYGFDSTMMDSDSATPKPELLCDVNGAWDLELTPDTANDPQDADGNAYTMPTRIDYHGNMFLIFPAINAAGQGSIEARVI